MQSTVGPTSRFGGIVFCLILAAIGAVYVDDSARAPVFPDLAYCLAGAGTFVSVPANTRTTSWQVNPGGPSTPDGWTTTPERVGCVHGTMWKGWKKRYDAQLAPMLPSLSFRSPKVCHAGVSNQLADWFNRSLMAKPELANAFGRCLDSISSFQEKFMKGLDAEASSATSRSVQQSLWERGNIIGSRLELDRKSACLKLTLASLGVSKSPSAFFLDQLASLEWVLSNGSSQATNDAVQLADRKIDDLTPSGTAELAASMSFADVKDVPDPLRDPKSLLPPAYGGSSSMFITFKETPALDRWMETATAAMECH